MQPKVINLKKGAEHKNLSEANLLSKLGQGRGKSHHNLKPTETVQLLGADKEYSRYVGFLNKAAASGAAAGSAKEADLAVLEPDSFAGMTKSTNPQIQPGSCKKFNLDEEDNQILEQEQQSKPNEARTSERDNERNMQKIQQLMLGDSSSMERASERISDPDPDAAGRTTKPKMHQDAMLLEEENSGTANELTLNMLNQRP